MPFVPMTPIDPIADHDGMPLLKVGIVRERLGCSDSSVRRLIRAGLLPVVRVGHLVRVREDHLWRYLTAGAGE